MLKALYINLGKKYANFSIGRFQMKPSFAEQIRKEAPGIMGRRSHKLVRDSVDFENERSFRASVVDDLEDTRTELNYLILFIKICEKRFELRKMTTDERMSNLVPIVVEQTGIGERSYDIIMDFLIPWMI